MAYENYWYHACRGLSRHHVRSVSLPSYMKRCPHCGEVQPGRQNEVDAESARLLRQSYGRREVVAWRTAAVISIGGFIVGVAAAWAWLVC